MPVPSPNPRRFAIAFSFPGERRAYVEQVAKALLLAFDEGQGKSRIFYDAWHESKVIGYNSNRKLQTIYANEADLVVPFYCEDYLRKEWCGVELRAIEELLFDRQFERVLPFRFDMVRIPGSFNTDVFPIVTDRPTEEIAKLILERYNDIRQTAVALPALSAAKCVTDGDVKLPDGTWLIERDAERLMLRHLRKLRITVALKGGRQLGKTIRAQRITKQMKLEGWDSANVDLGNEFADDDYKTGHAFLRRLAEKIANQTESDRTLLEVFDRDGTPTAFKTYIDGLKPHHRDYRLLLRLDRIDALVGRPCCSVVLSALRVLHNAQRALGGEAWFQMLLIHTITPRQTADALGSIFDVAKVVELPDFSTDELQRLATLYGLSGLDICKLHLFMGGHPTLSELTFEAMREDGKTLDQIIADSKIGGIFKQHLSRITNDFREIPNAKQIANSFRSLVQGAVLDSEETFDALLALGVINGTYSGDARVRCELYKAWLPPRIPK